MMECPNGSETQSPRDVSFTETEDDILWKRAHVRSNTDPSSLATRVAQTHDTRINQTVAVNESSLTARGALNQPLPPSALKSDRKRKHGRRVGFGEANDQQLLPENRVQFSVPPEHLQTNNDNVVQSGVEASLFETDSHVAALTTPADAIFFQRLSTRRNESAYKRCTQPINLIVVNLVVGEQDKTWTFLPSVESPGSELNNSSDLSNEISQSFPEERKVQDGPAAEVTGMRESFESDRADGKIITRTPRGSHSRRRSLGALPTAPPHATSNAALDDKPINWLVDDGMLCHAIPEAEIFQFGYRLGPAPESLTSEFYERVSQALRREIEKRIDLNLLESDQDSTNLQDSLKGPIIFIAFGDGGIIVELALSAAHEEFEQTFKSEKEETEKILEADAENFENTMESDTRQLDRARLVAQTKDLQRSLREKSELAMACKKRTSISHLTAGVIFLGTPFLGSNRFAKHLGKLIGRATTPAEQEYLGSKSKSLEALLRSFKQTYTSLGMPTWFFRASDMVSMHKSNIFKGNSADLPMDCAAISKFKGHEDLNYLQVLEKVMAFNNLRQLLDAASDGRLGTVQQLVKKGVDVNLTNGLGNTALHETVKNYHDILVEWLLRSGNAEVGIADNDGNTALHFAVMNSSVSIVRLLLESGADVKVKNTAKKSALDIARKNAEQARWQETSEQRPRDWRNDPIYWQLTHRPFLVEPDSALTKKLPAIPSTPSEEALEACNHHTVTAVEFFLGKRPRPERRSIFRMIYSKNASPTATLDHARDLAIENLKKAKKDPGESGLGPVKASNAASVSLSSVARWYHLPAHNMSWVQDFFIKMRVDVPSSTWTSQKHDSPHPHKRFIRPFAKTIHARYNGKEKKLLAFCMPFLDYETTSGRVKMAEAAKTAIEKDKLKRSQSERTKGWLQKMERDVTEYMKQNIEDIMKRFSSPRPHLESAERPRTHSDGEVRYDREGRGEDMERVTSINSHDSRGSFSESSTIRRDSGDIAGTTEENKSDIISNKSNDDDEEVLDIEFKAAKKLIIHGYLTHELPVLLRRTLDQYYYYMLPDTEDRDRDQVVFRHKRDQLDHGLASKERRQKLKKIKVVMVDQLWLWFIPKGDDFQFDTVLSCFPRRWCQNKPEDPDLLESMLNFEGKAPPISSPYDLITLITSKCANIFDRSSAPEDCQFLEFFESAIGSAADKEKQLFETFRDLSRKLSGNKRNRHTKDRAARAKDLDQFLNIDEETQLLIIVKDIQDEISTIMLVLNDQLTVLKNFIAEAKSLSNIPLGSTFDRTFDEIKCLESHQMIANNIRDFEKMASQAQKTYDALNHLLELKSRQANAWEARFAREGSEEAARQGTTVLVFTVVTIIFLPLSFMASFMALNIAEFPKDKSGNISWRLSAASAFVFGIAFAMAIPLVIIAFNVTVVRDFLRAHVSANLKRSTVKISRTTTHLWKSTISPSAWLSKAMDLIEDRSSIDKIPESMRKWKAKKEENIRKWERNLRNKEKEEILWQAKIAQIEMDEKAIYEDYKTSSEDEGKDRGGTDSELIEESESEVSSDVDSIHSNQSTWRKLKGGAKQGKDSLVNTLRVRKSEDREKGGEV